jgi:hypothetical protein
MRTKTLKIENPATTGGYGEDKMGVKASIEVVMVCENESDRTRALFALDAIWRDLFGKLDGLTHNEALPASEAAGEVEE